MPEHTADLGRKSLCEHGVKATPVRPPLGGHARLPREGSCAPAGMEWSQGLRLAMHAAKPLNPPAGLRKQAGGRRRVLRRRYGHVLCFAAVGHAEGSET